MSIDKGITAGAFYFTEKKRKRGNTAYHKIVAGEDLWTVSQRYGVQLRKLKKMNRLQGDVVTVGTMLWLNSQKPETTVMEPVEDEAVAKLDDDTFNWEAKETKPTVVAKMVLPEVVSEPVKKDTVVITPDVVNDSLTLHTVRKGESLYSISKLYGTEVSSILEENSLSVTDGLKTGQLIKIRTKASTIVDSSVNTPVEKDSVVARADEASYIIYEVKASDTLYGVARQHGVTIKEIMDWNGKDTFSLSLGEKLKIWKR
jgi:membrane-bound lytic murein transglycosylase D